MDRRELIKKEIRGMNREQLLEYISKESAERGLDVDFDTVDCSSTRSLHNYILGDFDEACKEIDDEFEVSPHCSMFPNAETEEDINEELEHLASRV